MSEPNQPSDEGLHRLQKELYAKDEGEELVMRRKELSSLGRRIAPGETSGKSQPAPTFENVMSRQAQRRRKRMIVAGAVVGMAGLFAAAVIATMVFRSSRQVHEEQISVMVQGPSDVVAGSEAEYIIAYHNNSRVSWEAVELTLNLPEGFQIIDQAANDKREMMWQLGNVERGKGGEVRVKGRLNGEEGAVAVTQAELTLTPENFPSGRFSKKALFTTTVVALPIQISIDAAQTAGSGERIRGVIHVQNLSSEPLQNAVLTVAPAPGVELAIEDLEFSAGYESLTGQWELAPIPSLDETARTIIFTATGQAGEKRGLDISLGIREEDTIYVQRKLTHVVALSASELTITQAYNGSPDALIVFPEEPVKGEVRYANVGTVGMRSAILTLQFEGAGLEVESLKLKQGAYDPRTNQITWTAASVPELSVVQPGESGVLEFDFSILPAEKFPASANSALVGIATIDSQDLPTPVGQTKKVISDRAVLSVGTQLLAEPAAFYDDGRLGISSTGPVPPKAGQTTTYTVRIRFGSLLNDVGEAKLIALLPDGVEYTNKTVISKGSVEFNERSREVQWLIPLLEGGTGRTRLAEELYFQVAVTPGANLAGKVIPFLSRLVADGQDTFIDELVKVEVKELPTTETASPGQGQVE